MIGTPSPSYYERKFSQADIDIAVKPYEELLCEIYQAAITDWADWLTRSSAKWIDRVEALLDAQDPEKVKE